jgi:OOP family OmpA-OmpF porin
MGMRLRATLIAATILGLPVCAWAQPIEGLYVGAGVGLNLPQNVRTNPPNAAFGTSGLKLQDNVGGDITGAVGYAIGGGFRVELEGDWIRNGVRHLEGTPFPTSASGRVRTYGLMTNVLYDFDVRSRYVFPYLGFGLGYMWEKYDGVTFSAPNGSFIYHSNNTTGKFAWQIIAGLAFPVPHMPGLSLLAQYRLLDVTAGKEMTGAVSTPSGTIPATLRFGPEFSHTFLIGVRYAFHVTPPYPPPTPESAPAPSAAPAPVPAPARSYLVFFDWDKATLTDRAREIIRVAADAASHVQYTQIRVNGYTDTSGSPAYNRTLSLRRARNVAAELVRDGVPRSGIIIRGYGETHLLVPTGPNVREPQNRRVEIIIES